MSSLGLRVQQEFEDGLGYPCDRSHGAGACPDNVMTLVKSGMQDLCKTNASARVTPSRSLASPKSGEHPCGDLLGLSLPAAACTHPAVGPDRQLLPQ